MPTKKTRKATKRAAKPKVKEEPQVAPPETEGAIFEVPTTEPHVALPFGAKADVPVPADGTLLRMDGAPAVFVMRDGQRRPFASAEAFTACGFGWNDIVVLPPAEIVPIPVGPEVVRASDL